jgi:GWxTD domain-containing protein
VLDSSRSWRRELSFSPGVLAAMPVWITGVELRVPGGDDGSELTAELDSLRFAVDLQRRRQAQQWPEAGLALVGEASGLAEGELSSLRRPLPPGPPASETSTVPLVWPAAELPFGRCRIQMSLELARGREQVRLPYEPPLELVNLRVPLDDDQAWRRHLDWLEGIVAQSRRDTLAELPPADRPAAWAALWRDVARARGEDPATARNRHLRRVVAADDRFGAYGRGAESDRGRTLIRWGEPAAIETYADARIAGASWEVWDYPERGRRLFFYDAHGLGDYRLRRQEELDR